MLYQTKKAQQTPSSINAKGSCGSSYGKVKILKDKEKTLKEGRGKQIVTYNGTKLRLKTFFYQKHWKPEDSGMTSSKCKNKTKQNKDVVTRLILQETKESSSD